MKNLRYIFFSIGLFAIFTCPWTVFATDKLTADTQSQDKYKTFIISFSDKESDYAKKLSNQGLIKNEKLFNLILQIFKPYGKAKPGGYRILRGMNELQVAKVLISEPYMRWVVIPEGFRKEQIAEVISKEFSWTDKQKSDWVNVVTTTNSDYIEGVYFPDTYLIARDETGPQVAKRLINRFNEKFNPYQEESVAKGIKWTTVIKVASLIQREAANKEDMPLISGIIWNRLEQDMKLDIDATVQYISNTKNHLNPEACKNKELPPWKDGLCFKSDLLNKYATYVSGVDWWKPISVADKKIDSPYNTYLYKGLPPYPIANPGTDAIIAALNPSQTDCLYYFHGEDGIIHCSKTYEEHLGGIVAYLR